MFLGHHATQLTTADSLPIPAHWHATILNGAYLTQGFDQNILILPEKTFETLYERVTAVNIANPLARLLLRSFLGTATHAETSANFSITLPANLTAYANITTEVVLVGQGEYVEVWSADGWQQQEAELRNTQANATRFSEFTLTTSN